MKRLATAGLVLLGVLALSACAPDTSDAEKACITGKTGINQYSVGVTEEELDGVFAAAEECMAEAKADPAGFNARWLD